MAYAYSGCTNLTSAYFYSNNVDNARGCFANRSRGLLNIYVHSNTNTLNTIRFSANNTIVNKVISWTNDMTNNSCYYNTYYNIYIYPVANVAAAREANGD